MSAILKWLNQQPDVVAEKVHGGAIASGRADIVGCYKGRALRIEVKTPDRGNTPSRKQELDLKRWHSAGAIVIVAYSLAAVKKVLLSDCLLYKNRPSEGVIIVNDEPGGLQSWGRFMA